MATGTERVRPAGPAPTAPCAAVLGRGRTEVEAAAVVDSWQEPAPPHDGEGD